MPTQKNMIKETFKRWLLIKITEMKYNVIILSLKSPFSLPEYQKLENKKYSGLTRVTLSLQKALQSGGLSSSGSAV